MAGLVPAIHDYVRGQEVKTWMPGTGPGMTIERLAIESEAVAGVN
jgi:hypothetical protein